MKKNTAPGILCVLIIILIFALAVPAFAQEETDDRHRGMGQEKPVLETRKEPADFGQSDWAWTWLSATDFKQDGGPAHVLFQSGGYYSRAADSGTYFIATIKLPSGSQVMRLQLYAYDDNVSSNILWWVYRNWTDLPGERVILFAGPPTDAEGYSIRYVDPIDFIIDNYHQYQIEVYMPLASMQHQFKGVRIGYQRQISPAPSTATFPDVPTTHGFFRNIEALVASGITTGFSDGTFRPNEFVTRGQMAAFLSRALGLHFSDHDF